MAKSQRSKVKRRWRSLKRIHIENTKVKGDVAELSSTLEATIQNRQYRKPEPKNAFLHPDDPEAVFPQYKPPPLVDFRSSALPYEGSQFVGAMRKQKLRNHVTSTIVLKDEDIIEQEIQSEEPEVEDDNILVNAMEGVNVKSKREIRKERKAKAMEIIEPLKQSKDIKKNRRKQQSQNQKSKKIITF